jgi:hypothetical protein
MSTFDDGHVRLTLEEVSSIDFVHLISGLDDPGNGAPRCGALVTISGYTEWIGLTSPELTVGWDWEVGSSHGRVRLRRVGLPRTNVLLVDASGRDFDWEASLAALAGVVDALAWQEQAESAIAVRYAGSSSSRLEGETCGDRR